MDISYKEEFGINYMVMALELIRSEYEMRLVENKVIKCLVPAHISQIDGKMNCFYDVSGKISLSRYLSKKTADAKLIRKAKAAIAALPETLEDFLINCDCIMLSPETVFLSADGDDFTFCYYPGETGSFMSGIRDIANLFIKKTDHQEEESTAEAYKFFETVYADDFSLKDLRTENPENIPGAAEAACKPEGKISISEKDDYDFMFEDDYNDFGYDYEAEEKKPETESRGKGFSLKTVASVSIPAVVIILTGIFLFSEVSENISFSIRIACFVLVFAAMCLTAVISLRKNSSIFDASDKKSIERT